MLGELGGVSAIESRVAVESGEQSLFGIALEESGACGEQEESGACGDGTGSEESGACGDGTGPEESGACGDGTWPIVLSGGDKWSEESGACGDGTWPILLGDKWPEESGACGDGTWPILLESGACGDRVGPIGLSGGGTWPEESGTCDGSASHHGTSGGTSGGTWPEESGLCTACILLSKLSLPELGRPSSFCSFCIACIVFDGTWTCESTSKWGRLSSPNGGWWLVDLCGMGCGTCLCMMRQGRDGRMEARRLHAAERNGAASTLARLRVANMALCRDVACVSLNVLYAVSHNIMAADE